MAGLILGPLQQFHFKLAVPSGGWTTGNFFAGTSQDSSFGTRSSSTCLSSTGCTKPLRFQLDCAFRRRCVHFRCRFCAVYSSTAEPPVLYSTPATKPRTLYDVLGISDMVTDDEIKAAFRRIAKEVHPDQAPPDQVKEYQRRFMEVLKAYSVLKDPQTRSLYNYEIKNSVYSRQTTAGDWKRLVWRGCNWETDQCWTS